MRDHASRGRKYRHGSALAHKTHIFHPCPASSARLPGGRSWPPATAAARSADRRRRCRAGARSRSLQRPVDELPPDDPRQRSPHLEAAASRQAAPRTPRSFRHPPRRRLAGDARLDRRLRVRRRPDRRLLRRHLPRQVPVRLRHLGIGRRHAATPPQLPSRSRTTAPRCSTRAPAPAPGPSAADHAEARASSRNGSTPILRRPIRRCHDAPMSEAVPTPDPKGPQRKPPKEAIAEAKVRAPTRGQPQARELPRGRQRRRAGAGLVVHGPGPRRAARDVGPLLGPHADRPQHRPAAAAAAGQGRGRAGDGRRPRDVAARRRGRRRRRRPAARRRHVDPPRRPRGVQPLPRQRRARPAARRPLQASRSGRSSPPRSCTRSSATAAAASPTRSRPASSASPTRSTWPRAAPGSRSRPARRASTRSPRRRSTRCGSRPGRSARCGSRSSSTTRPASSRSTTCWRRRSAARPLEGRVEVVAKIEGETEKRLLSGFRLD